jgi:hypothetical protein
MKHKVISVYARSNKTIWGAYRLTEYEPEDLEQLFKPPQLFWLISNVSIGMFNHLFSEYFTFSTINITKQVSPEEYWQESKKC